MSRYDHILTELFGLDGIPQDHSIFEEIRDTGALIEKKYGDVILPQNNETCAISVARRKTAALFFDRIYDLKVIEEPVPKDIAFYCATESEVRVILSILTFARHVSRSDEFSKKILSRIKRFGSLSLVASEIRTRYGLSPVLLYDTRQDQRQDWKVGTVEIILNTVTQIPIVDEMQLTWEQVSEFRRDDDARLKYKRFLQWLSKECVNQSPQELADTIAIKLDDYKWSLKKHGLRAAIGTLSSLLDPKCISSTTIAAAGGALVGGSALAALAGAGLLIGNTAITLGTIALDWNENIRSNNYEIAYIHEIEKRFKQPEKGSANKS